MVIRLEEQTLLKSRQCILVNLYLHMIVSLIGTLLKMKHVIFLMNLTSQRKS